MPWLKKEEYDLFLERMRLLKRILDTEKRDFLVSALQAKIFEFIIYKLILIISQNYIL